MFSSLVQASNQLPIYSSWFNTKAIDGLPKGGGESLAHAQRYRLVYPDNGQARILFGQQIGAAQNASVYAQSKGWDFTRKSCYTAHVDYSTSSENLCDQYATIYSAVLIITQLNMLINMFNAFIEAEKTERP